MLKQEYFLASKGGPGRTWSPLTSFAGSQGARPKLGNSSPPRDQPEFAQGGLRGLATAQNAAWFQLRRNAEPGNADSREGPHCGKRQMVSTVGPEHPSRELRTARRQDRITFMTRGRQAFSGKARQKLLAEGQRNQRARGDFRGGQRALFGDVRHQLSNPTCADEGRRAPAVGKSTPSGKCSSCPQQALACEKGPRDGRHHAFLVRCDQYPLGFSTRRGRVLGD